MNRPSSWKSSLLLAVASFACGGCGDSASGGGVTLGLEQKGIATYYDAKGDGNCSFDRGGDLMVAAMSPDHYDDSAACGACVDIVGPKGTVRVRIVDSCPDCEKDHLDLSREAFAKVAEMKDGRVDITWTPVSCDVAGPVQYRFKEDSNPWWTAIQVRNHRLPIQKLEWKRGGGDWKALKRESYNYFVTGDGVGEGSFQVRVTASDGQQLTDTLAQVLDGKTVDGAEQFAPPK
ncbi:expansin EXLX1 family cellulose-binding protein [Corallococcus sp. CA053C]|uniref:expansin EXLX1 family cellulose-binding protein n=1 Tax=Corallococcus sp. CA053C TaxID=2316732 RepID=UPI0018F32D18|nr:expansin EXLX1 family cellulose-binding protein [Corallococcus sp. CA053C]